MSRSIGATATGVLDAGDGTLWSVGMCAGADAATAILRSGGAGGTIIAKVGGGIGAGGQRTFVKGLRYTNLHLTITGTTPQVDVEVD